MTQRESQQSWSTLNRKRLRPVGAQASSLERLWAGASWAALGLGVTWFVFAGLRPMAQPEAVEPLTIKHLEPIARSIASIEERRIALESLGLKNRFAADGLPWPREIQLSERVQTLEQEADTPTSTIAQSESASPEQPQSVQTVAFEAAPEELQAEIKTALALLQLRGVYADQHKQPVAMVHVGPASGKGALQKLHVGDVFAVPSEKEPLWSVESIDVTSQAVVLSRSDVLATLSMYALGEQPTDVERDSIPGVPMIVAASENEILNALRDAGIDAEAVASLASLLQAAMLPDEVDQEQVAADASRALTDLVAASPEAGVRAGPPQMPPALRELFEQMAAQTLSANRNPDRRADAESNSPD